MFLTTASDLRRQRCALTNDQGAHALRAAEFVCAERDVVGAVRVQRDLACRLHGVAVKQRAVRARQALRLGNRLDDTGLVVHGHQRHERSALAFHQQTPQFVEVNDAVARYGTNDHADAGKSLFARRGIREDGIMFDSRDDEARYTFTGIRRGL